jgi:ABC-type transport system involved in multi-copper enzyme maturation permease subunit
MTAFRGLFWNPIVAKEVRSRMRTWRAPMVLLAFLAILGAVGYTAYQSTAPDVSTSSDMGRVGNAVFGSLAAALIVLVGFIVPGLVGGAISGERERQTLDLLMVTPVRPLRIVVGKLFSSLLYVLFLVVAAIPLFSIVFVLGGVALSQVVAVMVVTLVTVLAFGSLAMLCSAVMRRTTASTVSSYLAAFLLVVAPLIAGALIATSRNNGGGSSGIVPVGPGAAGALPVVTGSNDNPPPVVIYASPAAAMFGVLGNTGPSICRTIINGGPGVIRGGPASFSCGPSSAGSGAVIPGGLFGGWKYWEAFALVDTLVAIAALLLSVLVLRGRLPRALRRRSGEALT